MKTPSSPSGSIKEALHKPGRTKKHSRWLLFVGLLLCLGIPLCQRGTMEPSKQAPFEKITAFWKDFFGLSSSSSPPSRKASPTALRHSKIFSTKNSSERSTSQTSSSSQKPLAASASEKRYPYFQEIDTELRKRRFEFSHCFLQDKQVHYTQIKWRLFWKASGSLEKLEFEPTLPLAVSKCLKEEANAWTWVKSNPLGHDFSYQIQLAPF